MKFSLGGDNGLGIFADGYPKSRAISCDSRAPADAIEQTVSASSSGLSYEVSSDQYTYVWKTDKRWTGCRQLEMVLIGRLFARGELQAHQVAVAVAASTSEGWGLVPRPFFMPLFTEVPTCLTPSIFASVLTENE